MGYLVTAPLIQAKKQDGSYVHIYEGGFLPDDVDNDQLEQLIASEMVTSADADTSEDGGGSKPKRSRSSSSD